MLPPVFAAIKASPSGSPTTPMTSNYHHSSLVSGHLRHSYAPAAPGQRSQCVLPTCFSPVTATFGWLQGWTRHCHRSSRRRARSSSPSDGCRAWRHWAWRQTAPAPSTARYRLVMIDFCIQGSTWATFCAGHVAQTAHLWWFCYSTLAASGLHHCSARRQSDATCTTLTAATLAMRLCSRYSSSAAQTTNLLGQE